MGRCLRFVQPIVFCAGTLLLLAGTCVRNLNAQDARPIPAPFMPHPGIPEDWSTRHVIYTRNGSFEDMVKVRDDPRFLNSLLRQQRASTRLNEARSSEAGLDEEPAGDDKHKNRRSKRDWAVSLGPPNTSGSGGMAIGESPAKYTFNPSEPPSCSDFVVYTIQSDPKVGSQANLVGLTNLYSGNPAGICGTAPTWLFSYAIGSGPSELSPVISLDGTKVAWLENSLDGTGDAILHITTYVALQGTSATNPVAIGSGGSSDIALDYTNLPSLSGCTASPSTNTDSDLYVDYPSDTGYIGADNGNLYHISGVFTSSNPTVDFCTTVNAFPEGFMSGAVYDELMGEVFVSDSQTLYAYTVGPTSYTLAASYTYAPNGQNPGPGPMLDAFNNLIYMFNADTLDETSMTQLPTSLNFLSAVFVPLGPPNTNYFPVLFYGAFDNNYLTYGPAYGTNPASTIYSCGTDTTNTAAQDLFAIGFNPSTGLALTTPVMSANTNVNPGGEQGLCSPITEFYDGVTDRIFVGMGDGANGPPDGANAVTMWNVNTQLTDPNTLPAASASPYLGGTTGFSIDNNATGVAQAESIYFSTVYPDGSGKGSINTCGHNDFCAVKLTQSGLK
jgi:hypothetical protein